MASPSTRHRAGLRTETYRQIEAELRDYHATKRRLQELARDIAERGMGIAYDSQTHEQQASPEWSDPTPKRASALANHRLLQEMRSTVEAIEWVMCRLSEPQRRVIELHYFSGRPRDLVADTVGISRATVSRWRAAVIEALAERMGRW